MKAFCTTTFIVFMLLGMVFSCNKVNVYQSKAIILNRSIDSTLNDSALIYGTIYSAENEKTPEINAKIWIDSTNINTYSDSLGLFSLKLLPGTYTIKGLGKFSNDDMTIELKNVSILSNEKVEVKFLQGIIIEF